MFLGGRRKRSYTVNFGKTCTIVKTTSNYSKIDKVWLPHNIKNIPNNVTTERTGVGIIVVGTGRNLKVKLKPGQKKSFVDFRCSVKDPEGDTMICKFTVYFERR